VSGTAFACIRPCVCVIFEFPTKSTQNSQFFACCRHLVPQKRNPMLLDPPPPPPTTLRTWRRKNSTLEKILQHANTYIKEITELDPKGAQLHQAAFARHTLRLKERRGIDPAGELTVNPAALTMLTQHIPSRPRIAQHPADVEATQGVATSICLTVKANVRSQPPTALSGGRSTTPPYLGLFSRCGVQQT
jgi:hypothetical protein